MSGFLGVAKSKAIPFKTGGEWTLPLKQSEKLEFKMAKAERLLYLINLIKSHSNLTSKELAGKCEVSERTIFRDINSLASASLPIYHDHGYKFLEGAFLPTIHLTEDEFSTLRFAFDFSPIKADRLLQESARNVLSKLEAVKKGLRPGEWEKSKRLEQDQTGSPHETSKFFLMFKLLHQAIDKKRSIRIRYRKPGKEVDGFLIEPYALVLKKGKWLVLCYCWHCKKIVFYDVSRIQSVSLTTQAFKSKISLDKLLALHK